MQAAERSDNFIVDSSLQTTSTVAKESRCRSPSQSPSTDFVQRTSTPMRCRTVAVLRRWYRTPWASTTLAVGSSTDLFIDSHWLERSSSRFSVTLLIFSRAYHSTLQVLTTFYVVFISTFYWRLASKALQLIRLIADWSTAVTSHAVVNSDAHSIRSLLEIFGYTAKQACKWL